MKKIIAIASCLIMAAGLCSCGANGGNTATAKPEPTKAAATAAPAAETATAGTRSKIYSDEDIESAIKVIKDEFALFWKGCTLRDINYAGDDMQSAGDDQKKHHNADEAIVLISSFDVGPEGGDGSLSPNRTYEGYNWILVRNKGGQWKHVDHGY